MGILIFVGILVAVPRDSRAAFNVYNWDDPSNSTWIYKHYGHEDIWFIVTHTMHNVYPPLTFARVRIKSNNVGGVNVHWIKMKIYVEPSDNSDPNKYDLHLYGVYYRGWAPKPGWKGYNEYIGGDSGGYLCYTNGYSSGTSWRWDVQKIHGRDVYGIYNYYYYVYGGSSSGDSFYNKEYNSYAVLNMRDSGTICMHAYVKTKIWGHTYRDDTGGAIYVPQDYP